MSRRMSKLIRAHRERVFSLVMLPAFFLGTLPQAACICADGHRETNCPAMTATRGEHGCCSKANKTATKSCCQHGVCQAGNHPTPASGLAAKNGSCCKPVVETPAPAVTTKKTHVAPSTLAATVDSTPLI